MSSSNSSVFMIGLGIGVASGMLVAVGTCVIVGVAVCSCLVVIEKVYLVIIPHPVP